MSEVSAIVHEPRARIVAGFRLSLNQIMARLVDELARLRDDPASNGHPDSPVERWDDSYNVYLETSLPDPHGLEADISVQGGRIFLCVSKRPADHDSARGNLSGAS
jgi:hypothetical protein